MLRLVKADKCPVNLSYKYSSKPINDIEDFPWIYHPRVIYKERFYPNEFIRIVTNNDLVLDCTMHGIHTSNGTSRYYLELVSFNLDYNYNKTYNKIGTLFLTYDSPLILAMNLDIKHSIYYNSDLISTNIVRKYTEHGVKYIKRFYVKYRLFVSKNINNLVDTYNTSRFPMYPGDSMIDKRTENVCPCVIL
jgi:hypothetical protein